MPVILDNPYEVNWPFMNRIITGNMLHLLRAQRRPMKIAEISRELGVAPRRAFEIALHDERFKVELKYEYRDIQNAEVRLSD